MYENFFGFKEKPFKLVPNPEYLFLSKSHEEALAHLNYALSQGDGFVEISGEVGTGKTTLCRAFLESLNDDTVPAYIFNPTLGPRQLIKTICDELGIKCETGYTKDLIDNLNNFLIRQKTRRKKVILLIDEAQNLSKNVLEQLRLLSNLETNREKLLQIILVGQPELSDILDSHELRQLGQRITLRYRLSPLTSKETVDYIQYRIDKASQRSGIKFDRPAYRMIYRYSLGIPRVINIACDRVLLTAFGLNSHKITGGIAREAVRELKSRGAARRWELVDWKRIIIICAAAVGVSAAVFFHQPLIQGIGSVLKPTAYRGSEPPVSSGFEPASVVDSSASASEDRSSELEIEAASTQPMDIDPEIVPESEPEYSARTLSGDSAAEVLEPQESQPALSGKEPMKLANFLTAMDLRSSRFEALKYAMQLWHTPIEDQPYLDGLDDDQSFFRLATKPKGVSVHRLETNLDMLKRLNLPAILKLYPTGSEEPGYVTLSRIDGDSYIFGSPDGQGPVVSNPEEISLYWSGIAFVPWKNYLSIWGIIPGNSSRDSVITLKLLLHDIGYDSVELNDSYDALTRRAIEQIQAKYGMPVDGFVGPLTKIILYQEKNAFEMPHLIR